MNTLRNLAQGFIRNPFGIVICSFLFFVICILLVAIPFETLNIMIAINDSIWQQILLWIGGLLLLTIIGAVLACLVPLLRYCIEAYSISAASPSPFIIKSWEAWRVLIKWMLVFVAVYTVMFCMQTIIVIIETNTSWNLISPILDRLDLEMATLIPIVLSLFILLYLLSAIAGYIYIRATTSRDERTNHKLIWEIFVYKLTTIACGAAGAVFAIATPYIKAWIFSNDLVEELNIIGSTGIIAGAIVIIVFTSHNNSSGFKLFKKKGFYAVAKPLFLWGMALPAFLVSVFQEDYTYNTKPEQAESSKVKEITEVDNNEESYLDFNLQEDRPPEFFRTAFAKDGKSDDLNALLHEENPLSAARDFLFSSDYGAKKYVISIAKFDSSKRAINFRDKCLAEGHNIADSQVIQLILDKDYRVIFPPFNKKIAKGEASHKMNLIKDRIGPDSNCPVIEPTLLEFETVEDKKPNWIYIGTTKKGRFKIDSDNPQYYNEIGSDYELKKLQPGTKIKNKVKVNVREREPVRKLFKWELGCVINRVNPNTDITILSVDTTTPAKGGGKRIWAQVELAAEGLENFRDPREHCQ